MTKLIKKTEGHSSIKQFKSKSIYSIKITAEVLSTKILF